MSDQFADLWSSSAPKPKPQTLAASQKPSSAPRTNTKPDVFSLLAASSTPPPPSRPLTPSTRPAAAAAPPKTSRDAFSDLFSSSSGGGTASNNAKMTLAARLAMEAQQRTPSPQLLQQTAPAQNSSPWAGLDSLGGLGASSKTAPAPAKHTLVDDDWGLGDFGSAPKGTTTSMPQKAPQPSQKKATGLWDLDEFTSPHPNGSASDSLLGNPQPPISRSSSSQASRKPEADSLLDFDVASPDRDFDFGNREDQFDDDGQEDDILGVLNAPVAAIKAKTSSNGLPVTSEDTRQTNGRTSAPQSSSPPPHILGQLVEMGFSVEQAKRALKGTKDGQDVQAALESLLGGGGSTAQSTREERPPTNNFGPPPSRTTNAAPKGYKERERERLERQRQTALRDNGEGSSRGTPSSRAELQDQADKLLAQASEIGLSMFSKASAFWKEGKEKVVKAYEERSSEVKGQPAAGPKRPKWMQDAIHSGEDGERPRNGFKDEGGFQDTFEQEERERIVPKPQPTKSGAEAEAELNLFEDVPAPRRRSPAPEIGPKPQNLRQTPSSSSRSSQRPPTPVTRNLLTASPSALSLAEKHKTRGTEQFKLGQHAAAAESYTAAIAALPEGHLLLVPLHTNRALARLKTGEYAGAVADCKKAVEGVFGKAMFPSSGKEADSDDLGFADPLMPKPDSAAPSAPPPLLHPSQIPPNLIAAGRSRANNGGWSHPQGIGVDLLDGYVKALRRAAEACEGREKWVEAAMWWSVLSRAGEGEGGGWVEEKTRREAVNGGVRCRKMVDGPASPSSTSQTASAKPIPRQKLRPTITPVSSEPSAALLALQKSNAEAESEDAAKHALKDTVDARLSTWKTGKENNIRALLASLELVLWEGALCGLKMGMADLVSPTQVKRGYMKAIGRVHPDKLNTSNSTLEQRMLANGIFGTLNEAWIAFQTK
ncbi:hypothetical protein CVT26_007407 [Gymnopilus dilepis]|uniref:UBA domain-containing protein n=1 Tax=Gymnopilus dilepis TaxID=231916 RepID=A0A409VN43_9AGAR|nr:hypothetical protein CVT26_007407 [Gymnopilus dilepis]